MYINRQAKIASDSLFGDIKESFKMKDKTKSSIRSAMGGRLKRTMGCATSFVNQERPSRQSISRAMPVLQQRTHPEYM